MGFFGVKRIPAPGSVIFRRAFASASSLLPPGRSDRDFPGAQHQVRSFAHAGRAALPTDRGCARAILSAADRSSATEDVVTMRAQLAPGLG